MYCYWTQFCLEFQFLKDLKHIILGADHMKKNYPIDGAGLCTKTYYSLVLDEFFGIRFEFK